MILGQSAGIAAALVLRENVAVQALSYPRLRERLLAAGQVLDLPVLGEIPPPPKPAMNVDPATLPGLILDDAKAELSGSWCLSSNFTPHIGNGYRHDDKRADGQFIARFHFKAPKSWRYDLRVAYSAHETLATSLPYLIQSG